MGCFFMEEEEKIEFSRTSIHHPEASDVDFILVLKNVLFDLLPVHKDAVRAFQIHNHVVSADEIDGRVLAGDLGFLQDDVVGGGASDGNISEAHKSELLS